MTEHDVVCVGEALVDFVPFGDEFRPRSGGAPANVAAALASLGRRSALVSAVGSDWLGQMVLHSLVEAGVDTGLVHTDAARSTGVAIVAPPGAPGPEFTIYRSEAADAHLDVSESAAKAMQCAPIVHVSSLLPSSVAGGSLVEAARRSAAGGLLSYDVNLRPGAWSTTADMIAAAHRMIEIADVIKVTEAERTLLDLTISPETTTAIWLLTDGAHGARIVAPGVEVHAQTPPVQVVDSTGAGDATLAALLDALLEVGAERTAVTTEFAQLALARCVRIGAHVVQQRGAMCDLREFALGTGRP